MCAKEEIEVGWVLIELDSVANPMLFVFFAISSLESGVF
jgi:hypothetical protein